MSHSVHVPARAAEAATRGKQRTGLKLLAAMGMIAVAAFFLVQFFRDEGSSGELAYYFDLSEQKLFTAPRILVPPIRGINDAAEDAVRAVVISTNGNPKDKASRRIAYLEKYSPELKQQLEAMQKAQGGDLAATPPVRGRIDRVTAQANRFVRRPGESEWHPLNSPEAERIMTEWQVPGVGGREPVVCVP